MTLPRALTGLVGAALFLSSCSSPQSAGKQTSVAPLAENVAWDGSFASTRQSRTAPEVGTRGMVVSDDRIASEWGAEILRQGGNAIDAAVATAFALAVTRPHYAALGAGGFLVYCPKPNAKGPSACQVIDYREEAPKAATRNMYIRDGKARTDLSQDGALAPGVPGVTAGLLMALEKYGTMPRVRVLSRPIQLARQGTPLTSVTEVALAERWEAMNSEARRIWGCGAGPCGVGSRILQPELAKVLERISTLGTRGFYQGEVASRIVAGLKQAGGILTLEDLAGYRPKLRDPIRSEYQGLEIVTMPLPSSGGALIAQLFGMMKLADAELNAGYGSARATHAIGHAMALSFADRAHHFGDSDHVRVPIDELLSDSYLAERWKSFRRQSVQLPDGAGNTKLEKDQTTHFSVIDREGNAVAITTTLNGNFGSGFVPAGTGVVMNNQMDDFSIQPGTPNLFGLVGAEANSIAPGKRPLSSMSPTIVRDREGNARILIGASGGPRIVTSVFLSILNRLRFGMSLPDAVSAARVHQQWKPDTLLVEKQGLSPELLRKLEDLGWKIQEVPASGKIHALERFANGRVWGVPDIRGEGVAVAE